MSSDTIDVDEDPLASGEREAGGDASLDDTEGAASEASEEDRTMVLDPSQMVDDESPGDFTSLLRPQLATPPPPLPSSASLSARLSFQDPPGPGDMAEEVFDDPAVDEVVFDDEAFDDPAFDDPAVDDPAVDDPAVDEPGFDDEVASAAASIEPVGEPAGEPVGEPAGEDIAFDEGEDIAFDEGEDIAFDDDEEIIEELDDFEELDVDMLEDETPAPAAARPPAPPPRPSAPPPPRPSAPPPPSLPGVSDQASAPRISSPAIPVTASGPAVQPFEVEVATPTVLDEAIAVTGEDVWAERAAVLQESLDEIGDPDRLAESAHELGEILERKLGDAGQAAKAYNVALQQDPSLRANLWAIRRIFYAREKWPNLVRLIEAEIDYAMDDGERAELYVEKGHILEDRMDEPEEARLSYEYALDLIDPDAADGAAIPALMGLERLALASGDHAALEGVLERLVTIVSEPRYKLAYLMDMARAQAARGDLGVALDTVHRAVALGVDRAEVARTWLGIAEEAGDGQEVLAALGARIEELEERVAALDADAATDAATDADADADADAALSSEVRSARMQRAMGELLAVRRHLARVLQELAVERPDERDDLMNQAWQHLLAARELAPDEALLIADLVELAETLGRYHELDQLSADWQAREDDPARVLALGVRRVDALLRAGEREQALEVLATLSAEAPGYLALTALRERDALVNGDHAALADTYLAAARAAAAGTAFTPGQAAEVVDASDERASSSLWAAGLYVAAGEILWRRVGDGGRALEAYEGALAVRPGYGPAVEALADLYERAGDLRSACELCERSISDDTPLERRTHLLERASQFYTELGELDRALAIDKELGELDPDGARNVRRALRVESALIALERWPETVEVLTELAANLDTPGRRGAALYRAARICDDKLNDPVKAAALYAEVAKAWPSDRYARAALVSLLRRSGDWERLVEERRAEADDLADGPVLARALREAATVLERELGRPMEALDAYRELLVRMPSHAAGLRATAELLERISGTNAEQAIPELLEILEQEVMADVPDEARAVAAMRIARTHERSENRADALEAYRRAMDLLPGANTLAATAAVEIAAAGDDGYAYIEALEQLAAERPDDRVRAALLEELGWLWANMVEDIDRAGQTFEMAAAADATRPGPLLGMSLLQAKQKELDRLGETLARLGRAIGSPAAGSALMLRSVAIASNHHDVDVASERLGHAVELAGTEQAEAVIIAAEYALSLPSEQLSEETLARHIALFGARAELAERPRDRRYWMLCQTEAAIRAGRLGHARANLRTLFAEESAGEAGELGALQAMRRLARRGGDRATLARASLMLSEKLTDEQARLELYREAAQILDVELGRPIDAAPVYRRILAMEPGAPECARMLEIARQNGDIRALFEVISARIEWLCAGTATDESARELVSLYMERSQLRTTLSDAEGAIRDRGLLLAIDDAHPYALNAQARAMLDRGEPARAAELWQRYLEVEEDPGKRAEVELHMARILIEEMDDTEGAIAALEHVVAQSPGDIQVRERLIGLLEKASAWQRVVDELRALDEHRVIKSERARDMLRAARILRDKLSDEAQAADMLRRARALDPLNLEVIGGLIEFQAKGSKEREEMLAMTMRDVRRAIATAPSETSLYTRLATLCEWTGDRDARYFALAAADALGGGDDEHGDFMKAQAAALGEVPLPSSNIADDDWARQVAVPGSEGLDRLWAGIAEYVGKCLELDGSKLGFLRGDKVSTRAASKRFPQLTAVIDAFGVTAGEYYISDARVGFARVLSSSKPTLFLGADVATADSPQNRFLLGRAVAQAREGTGGLLMLGESDALAYMAAAFRVTGASVPNELMDALDGDAIDSATIKLQRQVGWLDKRSLGQTIEQCRELGVTTGWWQGRVATMNRAGLLIAGDVGAALDILAGEASESGLSEADALRELAPWMVSTSHLKLRHKLGMATRARS